MSKVLNIAVGKKRMFKKAFRENYRIKNTILAWHYKRDGLTEMIFFLHFTKHLQILFNCTLLCLSCTERLHSFSQAYNY